MNEQDIPPMTPEEIEEMERQAAEERERRLKPYTDAAKMRRQSAEIIAEHDDILAELMYNDTIRELED